MDQMTILREKAWDILKETMIHFGQEPVGTVAALDPHVNALNYDQCFIRDFISAALVFLAKGETTIVYNFLLQTLRLQIKETQLDFLEPGRGLMPASFKVVYNENGERLQADFGDHAIGRVTPVDSCLWWVFLLRAYVRATGDLGFCHTPECQKGLRLIMELCLSARFDMYPTLLVPDGACMIDRRMGINGHPLEIQSLFYMALRATQELLIRNNENAKTLKAVKNRINPLVSHLRQHYWLDLDRLNIIYRYKGEEYGENVLNQFNIYPESVPYSQLSDWLPQEGGYFVGNLGPSQLDCRFFSMGNLMAMITGLSTRDQAQKILNVIEIKWSDLVGYMPMKICFPALKGRDWEVLTGCDPKNRPWSYHNGGNWPVLMWLLVASAQLHQRSGIGQWALETAAQRLGKDEWPEYYDGKNGRLIGKEARKFQGWTLSGFLLALEYQDRPEILDWISFEPWDSDLPEPDLESV
ncbi:glycoside hydrolase 100 family protein [Prochlorothrix hollandica]|uniref:glycoside hydrolase 100 family protein n=1 Tax=Prochlorothrix hollandica TaxID=1223 RepID=UPI00333F44E4